MLHAVLIASSLAARGNSCIPPYRDPAITRAVAPVLPADSHIKNGAAVQILVTLLPDGSVQNAAITRSSGDGGADRAALCAARNSVYTPKIVNCQPVQSLYLFRVTFSKP